LNRRNASSCRPTFRSPFCGCLRLVVPVSCSLQSNDFYSSPWKRTPRSAFFLSFCSRRWVAHFPPPTRSLRPSARLSLPISARRQQGARASDFCTREPSSDLAGGVFFCANLSSNIHPSAPGGVNCLPRGTLYPMSTGGPLFRLRQHGLVLPFSLRWAEPRPQDSCAELNGAGPPEEGRPLAGRSFLAQRKCSP